jgi:coenzyme PQQ precursor peptide PqqA
VQVRQHAYRDAGPAEEPSTKTEEIDMSWETPKATDLRFGFEITMYVANR